MSAKRGVEFLKAIAEHITVKVGRHDTITKVFRITGGGDGRCIGEFTVAKEHLNAVGGLHGGYTATVVDNVTTYALISANSHPGVTVDLRVSYLTDAKEGDEIIVDANTLKVGKNLAFIECILKNKSNGRIIAKGGQTKYVDANTLKVGKNLAFIECILKNKSNGRIIAKDGQTQYVDN